MQTRTKQIHLTILLLTLSLVSASNVKAQAEVDQTVLQAAPIDHIPDDQTDWHSAYFFPFMTTMGFVLAVFALGTLLHFHSPTPSVKQGQRFKDLATNGRHDQFWSSVGPSIKGCFYVA